MKQSGSNAHWNKLSASQRKILDDWLFEGKLGYREILPRAQNELGFAGSMASLQRYHRRRRQERAVTDARLTGQEAAELDSAGAATGGLRSASMKLAGGYLFQALRDAPEKVKEWLAVANMMVQNDRNEAFREIKEEEHKIRREALAFAKEKFDFDIVEKALKALPELRELEEARKDPRIKRYEENARWNRVRRALLGADAKLRPESEEEEARMKVRIKVQAPEKLQLQMSTKVTTND